MNASETSPAQRLIAQENSADARPLWLTRGELAADGAGLTPAQRAWLAAQGFKGQARRQVLLPGADGAIAGAVIGLGAERPRDPMDKPELALGHLAPALPEGTWRLAETVAAPELAATAWGLGAYRFTRYKPGPAEMPGRLVLPAGADARAVAAIIDAVWLGRDLINTPASDMGPQEIEDATRGVAQRFGAEVTSIVGDDLLAQNFPMIHAVGRASPRAPRLIDLRWGRPGAPSLTLVGKGIAFDTGGLDIKPSAAMLLMKKDMGGAAAALAAAHMIMAAGLDVRLRLLIAAAENSISGNAFRPGDVLASRAGRSVEIGNTDAEGRLVLADALALADEEAPQIVMSFATLTGAARVALGPELPAMFTDDDSLAAEIAAAGLRVADPVWRLPLWAGYEAGLDSAVADMNNVSDGPFAGAVTAALFLRRFVRAAGAYAHFDLFAWRPAPKALGPKGGEVQVARAVFELLRTRGRT
ncbi:MAG: leucyl aminopeptidase family protein [Hyphomicrobiaceae bacterium]|nr:leucyl aminopeptidase family protein [Hyphomicrobiaceae bacterium]